MERKAAGSKKQPTKKRNWQGMVHGCSNLHLFLDGNGGGGSYMTPNTMRICLFAGRATLFFSRMCPGSAFRPGHWPFSDLYLLKPDACKENISFSREKLEEKNILCVFQGNFKYSIQ